MTRGCGVFRVMCPSGESGVGLASACWPDQKPVRARLRVTRHSSCRPRFSTPDRHRSCVPQPHGLEVGDRMLADQLDYIVGVDPHRDSVTRSWSSQCRLAERSSSRRRWPLTSRRLRERGAASSTRTRRGGARSLSREPAPSVAGLTRFFDRSRRAGARGQPAAPGAPLRTARPTRSMRSAPPAACSAKRATGDASRWRRSPGVAGAGCGSGRSRRREVRRTRLSCAIC